MNSLGKPLGEHLGELLAQRAHAFAELVRDTVRLLCREHEAGHVCLALADWQERRFDADCAPFPAAAAWSEQLLASGVCASDFDARAPLPLVLDASGQLYLLRHYRDERRILEQLLPRLDAPPLVPAATLRAALQALDLLPAAGPGAAIDWQLAAIAAAIARPFAVLTGGPGTGKTTTVAQLLSVLLALQPDAKVALAAPTGKAAARLGEALRARAEDRPELHAALDRVHTRTLHRLLGYLPLDDAFRFGKDQPLPYDLVVVDEVSMVDPALLAQLFEALRADARLLLVGDRDQLAAVSAGQVLGDLCRVAKPERGAAADLAAYVAAATAMELPVQAPSPKITGAVVALRTNHRFASQPGIGGFAQALAARHGDAAMATFAAGHRDLVLLPDAEAALAAIAPALLAAAAADGPAAALQHLLRCRVLTATRHGPTGADAWNRRIEALLRAHDHRVDEPFYLGRPVLVTVNDHQSQIWNGDLGVVAEIDGRRCVVFEAADGHRAVSLLRLPNHETAWAMTVHKAQGSEFDEVLLAMPSVAGPLWQASLVYTGVTRARRRAIVCADPTLLAAGLQHWPQRSSGLAHALADEGRAD